MFRGWVGGSCAKDGEFGTEPELSLDMLPVGERGGIAVETDCGVAWSYVAVPVFRLFAGRTSWFRGGVFDTSDMATSERIDSVESLEFDRDR